jgi:hypothetical protein
MARIILITSILLLTIKSGFTQDSLSKEDILEKMKIFRKCKKEGRRHLTKDSVYFIVACRSVLGYNYIEFYKRVKNAEERRNWIIYQFYFQNDNLIFIVQGTRNRKHFSEYYLNQGNVFSSELDNTLPRLPQDMINQLKTRLLIIRNSSPQ